MRTLYETLTNSRLGIISDPPDDKESAYRKEIPYRRRSATTWLRSVRL